MSDLERRPWEEFKTSGLLWWVNRTLHLFGWVIVVVMDEDTITEVYPARCSFRGFLDEDQAFQDLTKHIRDNIPRLMTDVEDESEDDPSTEEDL